MSESQLVDPSQPKENESDGNLTDNSRVSSRSGSDLSRPLSASSKSPTKSKTSLVLPKETNSKVVTPEKSQNSISQSQTSKEKVVTPEKSASPSQASNVKIVTPDKSQTSVSRSETSKPERLSQTSSRAKQSIDEKNLKWKNEILRQKLQIEKLERDIQCKCNRGFPSPCLYKLKAELCCEKKKLEKMMEQYKAETGNEKLPSRTPSAMSSKISFADIEVRESLLNDNDCLENDRHELRKELMNKDQSVQEMEDKLDWMQNQVITLSYENKLMNEKLSNSKGSCCENKTLSQVKSISANSQQLACSIKSLESNIVCLRKELDSVKRERKISFGIQESLRESTPCSGVSSNKKSSCTSLRPKSTPCGDGESQISTKLKLLECQYANLQTEYCRKQNECKETVERMKKCLDNCKGDKERAENEALKNRADEMIAEIDDYKIFIKELQEQVDMYREKFMKAQEKVEHQKFLLENLEMSNKDVESQINDEISRIKEKFQEKLSQLCPYPKMYEEAKVELEESKEKISELETDLKATMTALCKSKCELKALKEQPDESLEKKYKKLQSEVEMLKTKHAGIKATKECLEDKLTCMKSELESLRKDSTKIITTTKCCAEKNRQILHQHINGLEVDLAKSRAAATVSLKEKEETIKKMKQELALLCGSFNDCQGQIKQLKNQVTYLTNQRHKIRPEDLNKINYCNPEC